MEYDIYTVSTSDYKNNFWNKIMRGQPNSTELINKGSVGGNMYAIPYDSNKKYMDTLKNECIFRQIATSIKTKDSDLDIWVSDSEDPAEWAPSNSYQTIKEVADVFTKKRVKCHKLTIIDRIDMDFMQDMNFNMEDFLIKRFAKRFGKAEEEAFVNGTGVDMPTGVLHETDGADVGVTADALTFDDVVALYFSVKPEYHTKGVWLMNDETAQKLRTLKDKNSNYIWNHANDTIMSRPVSICNAMPSTGKIIAFGNFSYYWIMNRMPISVRALTERYALNNQVGYLAHEYLDAKLIRSEAVKVLQLK
ncbi:phage major capsid protein [Agathobaculum butyriciproducens]|nr:MULTISPECIES: phage major capsid protein [unclassified Butyricicoccus]RHO15287.1 phage major capsid protein [Butyricicoccus sp. AM18-35]RHV72599.1 phage major capsid protein [Butyricicoccus sp. OF13-6]